MLAPNLQWFSHLTVVVSLFSFRPNSLGQPRTRREEPRCRADAHLQVLRALEMAPACPDHPESLATPGTIRPDRRTVFPADAVENPRRAEVRGEFAGEAHVGPDAGAGGVPYHCRAGDR